MPRPSTQSATRALGAVLALACASQASAQDWSVGVKGGFGRGSYTGQQEFDWQSGALSAVGFVNRRLTSHLSVQPELFQHQRLGSSLAGGGELTFSAHYLDLPLLLRFRLPLPGLARVHPFLAGGPSLSFEIDCNLRFVAPGLVSNFACGDESNTLDFGFSGAAGVAWTAGISTLVVEARGWTNARTAVLEDRNSRANGVAFLAGVSVPLSLLKRPRPIGPVPTFDPRTDAFAGPPATTLATPIVTESAAGKRVTVTAIGADARALLVAIARETGISMVVSDDVRRRVSLSLTNASPDEAIAAIVAQAGLSIVKAPSAALPAVVYYQLPVNVNQAPAEAIAARFGVSAELAKWIADSRPPRSDRQP